MKNLLIWHLKQYLKDVTYIERLCEVHGKVSYKYDLLIAYLRMLILEVADVGLDGAQTRKIIENQRNKTTHNKVLSYLMPCVSSCCADCR